MRPATFGSPRACPCVITDGPIGNHRFCSPEGALLKGARALRRRSRGRGVSGAIVVGSTLGRSARMWHSRAGWSSSRRPVAGQS